MDDTLRLRLRTYHTPSPRTDYALPRRVVVVDQVKSAHPQRQSRRPAPVATQHIATTTTPEEVPVTPAKARRRLAPVLLASMGVVVFVVGITVSLLGMRTNTEVQAQVQEISAAGETASQEAPASAPGQSDPIASHKVAPNQPRVLSIPSIQVKARTLPTGLDKQNQIQSPAGLQDVGWYTGASLPGNAGAMLMYGHLSGWEASGIFKNLNKLKAGQTITVERGDGKTFTYRVVKSTIYPVDNVDMQAALKPITPDKNGLNLMTCHGTYDKAKKTFPGRLVVFAEQV